MSYDSASLTTSDIKWLGVRPSDLDRYNVPAECRLDMSAEDIDAGAKLLREDYITVRTQSEGRGMAAGDSRDTDAWRVVTTTEKPRVGPRARDHDEDEAKGRDSYVVRGGRVTTRGLVTNPCPRIGRPRDWQRR